MGLRQLVVQRLCLIGARLIWPRVAVCEVLMIGIWSRAKPAPNS